jgi:hypothetical protein
MAARGRDVKRDDAHVLYGSYQKNHSSAIILCLHTDGGKMKLLTQLVKFSIINHQELLVTLWDLIFSRRLVSRLSSGTWRIDRKESLLCCDVTNNTAFFLILRLHSEKGLYNWGFKIIYLHFSQCCLKRCFEIDETSLYEAVCAYYWQRN